MTIRSIRLLGARCGAAVLVPAALLAAVGCRVNPTDPSLAESSEGKACPAEAITMEAAERQPGEENLYREEKYAARYEINMLRCIFCGLCEEACPKDAIYLSETFAPANYNRRGFIYGKDDLLIPSPVTDKEGFEKAAGGRVRKPVQ